MSNIIPADTIKCPHCHKDFESTTVSGIALVDVVGKIDARKRMYCRLSLDSIERVSDTGIMSFDTVKKIVLDNLNDFNRDVRTLLGFGLEVE